MHGTLVERLLKLYAAYGGYREDTKLRDELNKLNVEIYERQTGEKILVETSEMQKQRQTEPK